MSRKKKGRGLMHDYDGYNDGDYWDNQTRSWKTHSNGVTQYNSHVKSGWNTGDAPNECTNCDFHPKTKKQKYVITYETWKVMMALCSQIKIEWQALLTGTIDADGTVNITGYIIPRQEVTGASVKNLEAVDDVYIRDHHVVAGVHSHGNMNCFFSATDVEHTNMSLIKHNIVVNNKNDYLAQSRIELPCGMVKFIEGEVFTVGETQANIVGLENIVEKKYTGELTNGHGWTTAVAVPMTTNKETGKAYTGIIAEGMRWCPVCHLLPEEDSGYCSCWTKGHRAMLPDFTEENYEKDYGKSWKLKADVAAKHAKGTGAAA